MPRFSGCYDKNDIPPGVKMPTPLRLLIGGALLAFVAVMFVFFAFVAGG